MAREAVLADDVLGDEVVVGAEAVLVDLEALPVPVGPVVAVRVARHDQVEHAQRFQRQQHLAVRPVQVELRPPAQERRRVQRDLLRVPQPAQVAAPRPVLPPLVPLGEHREPVAQELRRRRPDEPPLETRPQRVRRVPAREVRPAEVEHVVLHADVDLHAAREDPVGWELGQAVHVRDHERARQPEPDVRLPRPFIRRSVLHRRVVDYAGTQS